MQKTQLKTRSSTRAFRLPLRLQQATKKWRSCKESTDVLAEKIKEMMLGDNAKLEHPATVDRTRSPTPAPPAGTGVPIAQTRVSLSSSSSESEEE